MFDIESTLNRKPFEFSCCNYLFCVHKIQRSHRTKSMHGQINILVKVLKSELTLFKYVSLHILSMFEYPIG